MLKVFQFIVFIFLLSLGSLKSAESKNQMLMITDTACMFCVFWENDVGKIYPKTDISKLFPLFRIEIKNFNKVDNKISKKVNVTPTFIFIENENEKGRIIGYSSAELFWWQVDEILEKN
tara:strand:+ start:225 stop:581 length:357 start_codon:yes stop_codon:yes gene_type:complete